MHSRIQAAEVRPKKIGVRYTFNCVLWFRKFEQQLLYRFPDACMAGPSARSGQASGKRRAHRRSIHSGQVRDCVGLLGEEPLRDLEAALPRGFESSHGFSLRLKRYVTLWPRTRTHALTTIVWPHFHPGRLLRNPEKRRKPQLIASRANRVGSRLARGAGQSRPYHRHFLVLFRRSNCAMTTLCR